MILQLNFSPLVGTSLGNNLWQKSSIYFQTSRMSNIFKHTSITLIPKLKNTTSMIDYRIICLCNTFYKVITKVLANNLKKTLSYIIHQAQIKFIKGRDIADNISLAQEICGDFNYGGFPNSLCVKFDLKKKLLILLTVIFSSSC